jgi:cystathionine beta-synthase
MHASGTSHLILTKAEPPLRLGEVQGILDRTGLMKLLAQGRAGLSDPVGGHANRDLALVGVGEPLSRLQELLDHRHAVIVMEDGLPARIVSADDVAAIVAGCELPAEDRTGIGTGE